MAIQYIKPSTYDTSTWENEELAYDGIGDTDNGTYASEINGDSNVTWSGMSKSGLSSISNISLKITYEMPTSTSDQRTLKYSIDGGNNWTFLLDANKTAVPKTTTNITLSNSQDLSLIHVYAFLDLKSEGDSPANEMRVWDIRAEVTGIYGATSMNFSAF